MHPPFDSSTRLRFAPSPTGFLHVGGARTALFNWLLARRCGGTFILRIEDTDRERSTDASVNAILDGLRWLGLDWDEGPLFQTANLDRHKAAVQRMLESGHAYACFCTEAELEAQRERAKAAGKDIYTYEGTCRALSAGEVAAAKAAGKPFTVRFRVQPGQAIEFEDMIGGPRRFETDQFGDFIIQRSDGSPVFHLGVVVDDHDMRVTHILRGDDHLTNTPRQILLFRALGWEPPAYGHLPMIQGPDRTRLSKRHGATSVLEFEREGFLPEAMVNFLALLGWSYDEVTEIMTGAELIERFSIERVNRAAAVFDREKLAWMNGMYIRQIDLDELSRRARQYFITQGIPENKLPLPWFRRLVAMQQERARTLREMLDQLDYFFADRLTEYESAGVKKILLKPGAAEQLASLEDFFATLSDDQMEHDRLESALRQWIEARGEKFGTYAQLLRLALTGRTASPGIFDVLAAMGRDRTLARLRDARDWLAARGATSAKEAES